MITLNICCNDRGCSKSYTREIHDSDVEAFEACMISLWCAAREDGWIRNTREIGSTSIISHWCEECDRKFQQEKAKRG